MENLVNSAAAKYNNVPEGILVAVDILSNAVVQTLFATHIDDRLFF